MGQVVVDHSPAWTRKSGQGRPPEKVSLSANLSQQALLGPFDGSLGSLYGAVRALLDKSSVVLHLVSSVAGEGTSTIARDFAHMAGLALRHKILLIETRQHKAETKCLLDSTRHEHAFEALVSKAEPENFWRANLHSEGKALPHEDVRTLYRRLKEHFDLILIDCPAIAGGAYADLVPQAADGVIMVIQAEVLRPASVAYAKNAVERLGGVILGAVLNRRKNYIPEFIYRYL